MFKNFFFLGPISPVNWNCKISKPKNARFIVFPLIAISIIGPKEYIPLKKVTKIPVLSKESDKHRFPNWTILQFQLTGEIGPWILKLITFTFQVLFDKEFQGAYTNWQCSDKVSCAEICLG